jgi:hypothetical protein
MVQCLTSDEQRSLISNILLNQKIPTADVANSVLRSVPQTLFRHTGQVTHHIGMVQNSYIVCMAGNDQVELRNKDTGDVKTILKIAGLHCSLEVRGVLFLGTQYKQIYAVNS